MDPALRASDEDRQRLVSALQRHTAAGRLDLAEYDARVAAALTAVTLGDLAAVARDLPTLPADSPVAGVAPRSLSGLLMAQPLLVAFVLAAVTLAVLAGVLAVAR
jgi:hypothetical protein